MRALRRLPVRIRLALISASLTFAILLLFAVVIGVFAGRQVRSEFDDELRVTAADLQQKLPVQPSMTGPVIQGDLEAIEAASAGAAAIQIVTLDGHNYHVGPDVDLGPPRPGSHAVHGYRVVSRDLSDPSGQVVARLQYAKPLSRVSHTIARIDLFLALGVFGGTALAFLAGLALARRAMAPIAGLTRAARHIAAPGITARTELTRYLRGAWQRDTMHGFCHASNAGNSAHFDHNQDECSARFVTEE